MNSFFQARPIPDFDTQPARVLPQGALRVRAEKDILLLISCLTLFGLLMITSASMDLAAVKMADPHFFLKRQIVSLVLAATLCWFTLVVPLVFWQKCSFILLLLCLLLLASIFVPGIGKIVNGSARWIDLPVFSFQPSELAKVSLVLFISAYLAKERERDMKSLGLPLPIIVILTLMCVLLLMEPDYGATAVSIATAFTLMFVGGASIILLFGIGAIVLTTLAVLVYVEPYRMERLISFMDPWADPFDSGFQLTQALIAVGRGEWFGVGLGQGVIKLSYLPEAHNDFIFAIVIEELGLFAALIVILIFCYLLYKGFRIARRAEYQKQYFASYTVVGLTSLLCLQAFISIGVNLGLLPTKGLVLPFLSYGGSSLIASFIAIGIIARAGYEVMHK